MDQRDLSVAPTSAMLRGWKNSRSRSGGMDVTWFIDTSFRDFDGYCRAPPVTSRGGGGACTGSFFQRPVPETVILSEAKNLPRCRSCSFPFFTQVSPVGIAGLNQCSLLCPQPALDTLLPRQSRPHIRRFFKVDQACDMVLACQACYQVVFVFREASL